MPPVFITAITTGLIALIPKALTDAYDYIFNGETIQVKKLPDKTELNAAQKHTAKLEYAGYIDERDMTQSELTTKLNTLFGTTKSVSQMMRICRSD